MARLISSTAAFPAAYSAAGAIFTLFANLIFRACKKPATLPFWQSLRFVLLSLAIAAAVFFLFWQSMPCTLYGILLVIWGAMGGFLVMFVPYRAKARWFVQMVCCVRVLRAGEVDPCFRHCSCVECCSCCPASFIGCCGRVLRGTRTGLVFTLLFIVYTASLWAMAFFLGFFGAHAYNDLGCVVPNSVDASWR
jgi:hypothetical protein